jgi:microcystin-dependent protein
MPDPSPFVAQIQIFPYNFPPRGWAFCNGQILSISQNTALFSLLGTTYGGNGITNFALPDLRGRVAVHQGQGPGLSSYELGEMAGEETVTLLSTQMPAHTHVANANTVGNDYGPAGVWATDAGGFSQYGTTPDAAQTMAPDALTSAGGSAPHNNLQPYLTMNYCIALQGIYPPRS